LLPDYAGSINSSVNGLRLDARDGIAAKEVQRSSSRQLTMRKLRLSIQLEFFISWF